MYPLLPCIVFPLPYIPVPFYISPLTPCIVFPLSYIPVPSTYSLYSLVSSLYSHISPYSSTYSLYCPVSSLHSYISLCLFTYPSTSIFLSSYNTLNEFAGQRSRKFLGKITEQAILPLQSFKEVINKRPCS